jgi:hypothetical protein
MMIFWALSLAIFRTPQLESIRNQNRLMCEDYGHEPTMTCISAPDKSDYRTSGTADCGSQYWGC